MEEWKKYKLGDIIHLIGGGTPKTTIDSFWNGDIPWLSVKDFNNSEKYVYQTEKSISKLGLEKSTTRLLQKNDIIISARGTVGEIAMLPFPMAFNQSCYGIRGDLDIIDQDYLYYLMKFKLAEIKSKTHGSVFDTITRDTFGNINCSLPAFNIQQKISNILSSFDDKIALNKRINDNLEQQALAIYRSWFVDFEPFKGGEFIDSELGEIPEGWGVGRLSDVGRIVGGSTPSKSHSEYYTTNGIPWLTPKDLSMTQAKFTSRGEIDITEIGYKSCSTKLLPRGSVLFSSRAPIGYISIALNEICTNQGFKSIVPNREIGTAFIFYYLKANTSKIESQASGSTFKEASGTLINSLSIIRPPLKVIHNFNEIMTPIFFQQEKNEGENEKLSKLRDTLLPKLMSGELKITDLNS
ncbi:restriction endonuclease subunit S [Dysgonomonas macrotermitis]|uniref:Type I restriction enzyme, S subunit n=3 Tax=Dysgonomonas macrotermitis TaxID=1346286 RepID=A0A1M4X854_9BACT|nr:restriction endonuclease subunit S [Dysgonomonas macrotermitis]SHE89617.1 type I restriction enzyme, S subunit [Dysgonomonas macrotermitis]